MSVILETTLGDIIVDLFVNERPRTCFNFLKLCKIKFYNYCLFHKVEKDFTAQTGDPESTGRGGESIFSHLYGDQAKYFEAETKPRLKHVNLGTLSMINNGQNMHGSQFFITLAEDLDFLDGEHTVFGQVEEGLETLQKINESICDEHHRPYQDIRISHTIILEDPYDDPPGLKIPDASPELTEEQIRSSGRIGADEEIDDTKGKSMEEIEEEIQDKEAKARATILEMVGDIPDAEVRPPDNVLFVCKLNPVTTSDDLEVIFSRFGTIVSCEVIKDKKTGESLQYAFIEFDKEEDCENAYFKMDNVLIDDRRIHVDFSQSVAKLNYQEMKQHAKNLMGLKVKDRALPNRSAQTGKKYDLVFEDEAPASNAAYKDLKKHIKEQEKRVKHSKKESKKSRKHSRSKSSSSERKKSGQRNHRDRREDEPLHRDRREDRSLLHRERREDRSLHRDRREDKPRHSGPISKRYDDRGRNEKDSTHHRREAKSRGYKRSRSPDSGSEVERRDRRRRDDRRPRDNSRK